MVERDGYWWCLKHQRVEGFDGCANISRLGPFPSRADAERAIEIVREREERYEAEDRAWSDPD